MSDECTDKIQAWVDTAHDLERQGVDYLEWLKRATGEMTTADPAALLTQVQDVTNMFSHFYASWDAHYTLALNAMHCLATAAGQ